MKGHGWIVPALNNVSHKLSVGQLIETETSCVIKNTFWCKYMQKSQIAITAVSFNMIITSDRLNFHY